MDGFKIFSLIAALVSSLLGIGSFIIVMLNRRTTARKETVDDLVLRLKLRDEESAKRDKEIEKLRAEIDGLTRRVLSLERENTELLTENRELRKQKARAQGRDSDDA